MNVTQIVYPSRDVKIRRILDNNCLIKLAENVYSCRPVPGYNTRFYRLKLIGEEWCCDCQGFSVNGRCSHQAALIVFLGGSNGAHE